MQDLLDKVIIQRNRRVTAVKCEVKKEQGVVGSLVERLTVNQRAKALCWFNSNTALQIQNRVV